MTLNEFMSRQMHLLQTLEQSNAALVAHLGVLLPQIQTLESQVTSLTQSNVLLSQKVDAMTSAYDAQIQELAAVKAALQQYLTDQATLDAQYAATIQANTATMKTLQDQIAALSVAQPPDQATIDALNSSASDLQGLISAAEARVQSLQTTTLPVVPASPPLDSSAPASGS